MSLEQSEPRKSQEIIKDGLNNLFIKISENGINLRVYGSALKSATYSADLTNEEASALKNDLELLLNKDESEIVIAGLFHLPGNSYNLKFTRIFGGNSLKIALEDNQSKEVLLKMKIRASDLLELLD